MGKTAACAARGRCWEQGLAWRVTWTRGLPAEVLKQRLLATGPAWGRCQQRELRLFLVHKTLWSCWMWLFQALSPAGDNGWAGKSHVPPPPRAAAGLARLGWAVGWHMSLGLSPALWDWGSAAEPGRSSWAGTAWAHPSGLGVRKGLHTWRPRWCPILKGWGQKGVWLLCCGPRVVHSSVGGREGPPNLGAGLNPFFQTVF